MKAYLGQTRSRKLIEILDRYGFGEMTVRGQTARRRPFAQDNSAYEDFTKGRSFDEPAFEATVRRLEVAGARPDFIVAPDIVAGGLGSLALSIRWLPRLRRTGWPVYLAVQDGMTTDAVAYILRQNQGFSGLFVGGQIPWKLATGGVWVQLAHERGMRCHIGRVGTAKRVRWALSTGADSIDSCLPLWSRRNLDVFVEALGLPRVDDLLAA